MAIPRDEVFIAQGEVLIPIARALEKELGKERAMALMFDALSDVYRGYGDREFRQKEGGPNFAAQLGRFFGEFTRGSSWVSEPVEMDANDCRFDVTRCKIAEFYKKNDAADLGFTFACCSDYPMNEGMGDDIVLERPQTIMEGAPSCKFRWSTTRDDKFADARRAAELEGLGPRRERLDRAGPV